MNVIWVVVVTTNYRTTKRGAILIQTENYPWNVTQTNGSARRLIRGSHNDAQTTSR